MDDQFEADVAELFEILEIEDDLDTGMHRVPVCKVIQLGPIEVGG